MTAGLTLGPWLWLGATEKANLPRAMMASADEWAMAKWLLAPNGLMWFWMTLGALWLLVLVGVYALLTLAGEDLSDRVRRRLLGTATGHTGPVPA